MPTIYSQKDPKYAEMKLGPTTIGKNGCLVQCIATLLQVDTSVVLSKGNFTKSGDMSVKETLQSLGSKLLYRGNSYSGGWVIAKTDFYAKKGYPTHFFLYHKSNNVEEVIDPLTFPGRRENRHYKIVEYITIASPRLDFSEEDLQKRLQEAQDQLKNMNGGEKYGVLKRLTKRLQNLISSPQKP